MSHLGLPLVGEYSCRPEFHCPKCGADLWTERSERTGWRTWMVTQTGLRHFKSKCNMWRDGKPEEK
jgi:hypothetical protein